MNVKTLLIGCGLAAVTALAGQGIEKPRFAQDHVLPLHSYLPRLLTRGQFVSIYGWNLVPKQWCGEPHEQREPYPHELCGARVLIGDRPAGLMYAGPIGNPQMQADQINLQVPPDAPESGMVPIRVCVATTCSDPVPVEFTAKDIILRAKEAFVHMPLWIEVEIPMNVGFAYPLGVCPWDFGGYEFEVRQNGRLLELARKPQCVPRRTMPLVFRSSKLPLHLVYEFDAPGTYEVRLSGPMLSPDQTTVVHTGRSDWVRSPSSLMRTASEPLG
jgi:hypothetical protein